MTPRAAVLLGVFVLAGALSCGGDGSSRAGARVIVLGFDGLDFTVTRELMASELLPSFARLARQGGFYALGTTIPPQSPVAWSTFITGLDPSEHGIFDFIHRDPKTMAPYLSTTRTEPQRHFVPLGRWRLPLTSGRVELLRRGRTFWEVLHDHGIETTVVRMPANFPPSRSATRELSGMGTPDLLGTYGTFSFYTSDPFVRSGPVSGGVIHSVEIRQGVVRAALEGPDHPLLRDREKLRVDFAAHVDRSRRFAKLVVGKEERLLRVGEWSDWVPVRIGLGLGALHAEVRFYLKALDPEFALYVSPLNIDPLDPVLPISSPDTYASELARATGRFYTQGMPEDTKAMKARVLSADEFLAQTRITAEEAERQYNHLLAQLPGGFLFYYFGHIDQVSHMLWRARDPEHPAYDPARDARFAGAIDRLYMEADAIVGRTLQRIRPEDLLVVMSDHGFVSWRRSFNLNTWLRDRGYLRLRGRRRTAAALDEVDWSKTRAYALGLNGLYINLRGRESEGIVEPGARDRLIAELSASLLATLDPATGTPAVSRVFEPARSRTWPDGRNVAPDLIVGYARGTRASDESALGEVAPEVFADNRGEWTGDHCMDPEFVPGVILTNRPLRRPAATLGELAPTLLAEFGISGFPVTQQER
jgi:predicted AlkP superfamily phosphohydrolase/phosphomutase